MTNTENHPPKKSKSRIWLQLWPIGLFLLGLASCFISSVISKCYYWDFFGVLLGVSLAALLVGGFLGFLFGIPKLNKEYSPTDDYDKKRKYNANTNLEEISDWVTKIIVGISLTQLIKIPSYMGKIADYVLSKNSCDFTCDFARAVVISNIIYFLIAGFIIGYFYTRIFLPNLLALMEGNEVQEKENEILWEKLQNVKTEVQSRFDALSLGEKEMLRMIQKADNSFKPDKYLDPKQIAALNVLRSSGVISVSSSGTSGSSGSSGYSGSSGFAGTSGYSGQFDYRGTTIKIIDTELYNQIPNIE